MRKIGISFLIIMLVFSIICIIPNQSLGVGSTNSIDGAGAESGGVTDTMKNINPSDYEPTKERWK